MKQFNLYSHPVLGPRAVKQGFSWPAFFLTGIWALASKLWIRASLMIVVLSFAWLITMAELGGFEEDDPESYPATTPFVFTWPVACLLVGVVAGARGNRWRDQQARNQGFGYLKTVTAQSAEAALTQLSDPKPSTTKEDTT